MSIMQNGQLKSKVAGANVPMLSANIYEFTPANADIDDLEVGRTASSTVRHGCNCVLHRLM